MTKYRIKKNGLYFLQRRHFFWWSNVEDEFRFDVVLHKSRVVSINMARQYLHEHYNTNSNYSNRKWELVL